MKPVKSLCDKIFVLIILFLSIEYVGNGTISVYRVIILPLSVIGIISILSNKRKIKIRNLRSIVVFFFMMIWFAIARLTVNDNWLFPVFNIPLGLFLFLYWNYSPESSVDYRRIFSIYSIPHIIALLTGLATWQGTRFAGARADSNFCSLELVIAIIASVMLFFNKEEKKGFRIFGFFNAIVSIVLLWLAGSRGAFLSLILISSFIYILSPAKKIYKVCVAFVFFIGFQYVKAYVMGLPDWVDPEQYPVDAFFSRFKPESLQRGSGRADIWEHVIDKLKSGNYFIFPLGREAAMTGMNNDFTHNTFLDFIVENGIIMGFFDLFVVGYAILQTVLALVKKRLSSNNCVFAWLALSISCQLFALSAISDKLFWLMVVFMMSVPILKMKKNENINCYSSI